MHQLYTSLGIPTLDVIEAASTKWNFMKLTPGLVGGHCISIDPYYLMHKSEMSGYTPNIMQASRKINDEMSNWVVEKFLEFSHKKNVDIKKVEITLLGYSFKENCSDTSGMRRSVTKRITASTRTGSGASTIRASETSRSRR